MTDLPLAGTGVLVTRPEDQAEELVAAIERNGGTAILFPALRIVARDAALVAADAAALAQPDIVVFVSSNAVHFGLQYAADAQIAVVGPATAEAVLAAGRSVDIRAQDGYDSEHLLNAMQDIDVAEKIVRIIRGQDGREFLADTLRERGATVQYLAVYERRTPDYSADEIESIAAEWRSGRIDVVTAMSVATFDNLVSLLPETTRRMLARTPLVTPAERVIKEALKRFPELPTTQSAATDANAIVSAIIATIGARA